jgi:hypothetical protein
MRLFTKAVEEAKVELSVDAFVPTIHAGKVVVVIVLMTNDIF